MVHRLINFTLLLSVLQLGSINKHTHPLPSEANQQTKIMKYFVAAALLLTTSTDAKLVRERTLQVADKAGKGSKPPTSKASKPTDPKMSSKASKPELTLLLADGSDPTLLLADGSMSMPTVFNEWGAFVSMSMDLSPLSMEIFEAGETVASVGMSMAEGEAAVDTSAADEPAEEEAPVEEEAVSESPAEEGVVSESTEADGKGNELSFANTSSSSMIYKTGVSALLVGSFVISAFVCS